MPFSNEGKALIKNLYEFNEYGRYKIFEDKWQKGRTG